MSSIESRPEYLYGVVVHYSPDDEFFYATIPALNIVTGGHTEDEAYAMAEDAISGWVADALDAGETLPVEDPPVSMRRVAASIV